MINKDQVPCLIKLADLFNRLKKHPQKPTSTNLFKIIRYHQALKATLNKFLSNTSSLTHLCKGQIKS